MFFGEFSREKEIPSEELQWEKQCKCSVQWGGPKTDQMPAEKCTEKYAKYLLRTRYYIITCYITL